MTKWVALLCSFSNVCIRVLVVGSQTIAAHGIPGLVVGSWGSRKGIKYRMSYPRWSTSLVVNKQFWSDQSAVDQNETRKRNQLPHDPTTNPGIPCAAMVCDPTTKTLIQTLENEQRRATHFVINDYTSRIQGCVTSMLTSLEWQTLEQRRRISRLVMMYKIQHQLVDWSDQNCLFTTREVDQRG
jgi:hypothetical protein